MEHILHGRDLEGDAAGEGKDAKNQPPVGRGLHDRLFCRAIHAKNPFHFGELPLFAARFFYRAPGRPLGNDFAPVTNHLHIGLFFMTVAGVELTLV